MEGAMVQWEYSTFTIRYQKKLKNWAAEHTNKPPLVGLQAILEAYGSEGWELVSLLPERSQAYPGLGTYHIEPEAFRATFKRPAPA
jgi:Domain of unknown function (DUF4177)